MNASSKVQDFDTKTTRLISRAQSGDQDAVRSLLRHCEPRIHRFVRRRIGTKLRSEVESIDVVQDVHLQVLRSLAGFELRGNKSFNGWLKALAENRIRDLSRRKKRRPELLFGSDRYGESRERGLPEREVAETMDFLRAALDKLPENLRQIIYLHDYMGYSFHSIAMEMNCSDMSVLRMHKQALARLLVGFRKLEKGES